jgi:hypothetical protein
MDDYAGNCRSGLQAFLDDLGFEWFGIRAALARGNPADKGDGACLKYADTIALNAGAR